MKPSADDITRYPLAWPVGWPRTRASDRQRATFSMSSTTMVNPVASTLPPRKVKQTSAVNMPTAVRRLSDQLDKLGASDVVLSTNVELRLDGQPRGGRVQPVDVGAAVYFRLHKQDRCLACDRWHTVEGNIAAIANHIDALRRIERYGIGTLDQMFAGYKRLPASGETWRSTLGFGPTEDVTEDAINVHFKIRARELHPDAPGGSHNAMAALVAARDEALALLR